MIDFSQFDKIKNSKSVCLIGHITPDTDALASMVLLKDFLSNVFKIKVVDLFAQDTSITKKYEFILGKYKINPKQKKYDTAIVLDCPNLDRVGIYKPLYDNAQIKANIDHHATNVFDCDIRLFSTVSSTCEILFDLFSFYNYTLNSNQLTKLYAALLTDTAGFSVGAITKKTFEIAGACIGKVDTAWVYSSFINEKSLKNQQLYAAAIKNIVKTKNNKFIITYLTDRDYAKLKVKNKNEETEGIINQLNTISSAKLVCFIYRKDKQLYVSMRAKNGYDVAKIAKKFGGGGHTGAAAYLSDKSLKSIIKDIYTEFIAQTN